MSGKIVGVISDTHGLMRPEALDALGGSDLIIHAGDVGKPEVLEALQAIAPVFAVRGNVDMAAWAAQLPATLTVAVDRVRIYIIHNLGELEIDPASERVRMVVSGHSHRSRIEEKLGVIYLNPGSAGPRRFRLPIGVAKVSVRDGGIDVRFITL